MSESEEPGFPPSGVTGAEGEIPLGTVVDGRFQLESVVSSSSAATLYVAIDQRTDGNVMLRVFTPEVSASRGDAILEQAASSFELIHPNVARVIAFGRTDIRWTSRVYVASERLGGGTLQDMIDRGRLLTPAQALVVGLDVCRALDHAHKRGILHHDLRPSAIVFGSDRKARVADLGVASVVAEQAWADVTTVSLERARYASPEQAQGEPFDEKSDVYALALCLVEAITGTTPFLADSVVATLSSRVGKLFPVSADMGGLASVLEKAGRSDPLERSGAAEMGRALVQAAPSLSRPQPLPIVQAVGDVDPDRTGDVTTPPEFSQVSGGDSEASAVPLVTGTMQVRDLAVDTETPVEPAPDSPLIGRWIVAAVAVLALITGGFFTYNAIRDDSHTVPLLTGLDQGEATNQVTEFGWDVVTTEEASDTVAVGAVIRTDPPSGDKLGKGKTLTLVVSTGPPPVPLPELNALEQAAAEALIVDSGLAVGVVTPEFSEDVPTGSIVRWVVALQPNLVAGQEVVKGTAVDIFVSQGPAPRVVPNLIGMSIDSATTAVNDLQLVLNRADDQFSADVAAGGVAVQTPAAGEQLTKGSSVTVSISKGPDVIAIPNGLTTMRLDKASETLVNAGFVVGQVTGNTRGVIVALTSGGQVVSAGQLLPRGSVIDIAFYG